MRLSLTMTAMWKTPMKRTTMTTPCPCHPYCSLSYNKIPYRLVLARILTFHRNTPKGAYAPA